MSTHAKVTVFSESNEPLLSFYIQHDGYFDGVGNNLAEFLKHIKITNGISGGNDKTANGMSCLAAQLVVHLKKGVGGLYIVDHDDTQEFNYEIRYVKSAGVIYGAGRVSLVGKCNYEPTKTWNLYDEIIPSNIIKTVSFVYDKQDGSKPAWRTIEVTREDSNYIEGLQDGDFRRFSKCKIVGGKIITE